MATEQSNEIPSPLSLLLIQLGGGILTVLPILTLHRFASLSEDVHMTLVLGAALNILVSLALLIGYLRQLRYFARTIGTTGEVGLFRSIIIYDMIMLGLLVVLTGGSELSAFGPQFAAILPIAMLVPDSSLWKWTYAGLFFLMFLVGLTVPQDWFQYIDNRPEKQLWFLVFFFVFTLFPVLYSINTSRPEPNELSSMRTP